MIIVPGWVEKEEPEGILVVLGSEPSADAKPEWLDRTSVLNCVYYDPVWTKDKNERRIALIMIDESKLPERLKQMIGTKK